MKLGVIGSPIEHSKSPEIHTSFANQFDLDLVFDKYLVDKDECLEWVKSFFEGGGLGLSVTLPLKELVLEIETATLPSCCYSCDSEVILSAEGGIFPYSYGFEDEIFQAESLFDQLCGDSSYTFKILDNHGCEKQDSLLFVTNRPCLVVDTINYINADLPALIHYDICRQDGTAKIYTSAFEGVGYYSFSIDNGPFIQQDEIMFDINVNTNVQSGSNLNPQINIYSSSNDDYNYQLNFDLFVGLLVENFETGDFSCHNWDNFSLNSWTITNETSSNGDFSAVSGLINDNQSSSLSITMEVLNDGLLEFDYKVSAEYSSSGNFFYDGLEFYIDGQLMDQFQTSTNGTSLWNNAQYDVSTGNHDFVWTFIKDGGGGSTDCTVTSCEDAAYIDNIKFPFSEPEGILGDSNSDGVINILDIVQTVGFILDGGYNSFSDVNNDGSINVLDIVQIVSIILNQ